AKVKDLLKKSEMGALLCFDMNNVRYLTATHIGTWAQDKANRFTLLPQNDEPILWDFGSAAKHHQLHCPWLGERSRTGISMLRGAMTPEMGRAEDVARKIRIELEMRIFLATSSARPISGVMAPRNIEIPVRDRSPSHGQCNWWCFAADPKSHKIGSSFCGRSVKRFALSCAQVPMWVAVMYRTLFMSKQSSAPISDL